MNFWLSFGFVVAFANFIYIESKKPHVLVGDKRLIRLDDYSHKDVDGDVKPSQKTSLISLDDYPHVKSQKTSLQNARISQNLRVPMNSGTKIMQPINVKLEGEYFWDLIYYIDNTNKDNPYKETRKIKKVVRKSYTDLQESVVDIIDKLELGLQVSGVFEIISVGVHGSLDMELSRSYKSTVEQKSETVVSEEIVKEFTVGANSIGEMYRLVYEGPGVIYESDTVSTNGNLPLNKVIINCKVRQIPLLKDILVEYTAENVDRPDNLVTETNGLSPDINDGFDGMFVWLVPIWTLEKDEAATKIQFVLQYQPNENYGNLAQSAAGGYRYLKLLRDLHELTRIYRIGLLRSNKYVYDKIHEYGWDGCTTDINENRGGNFLHLCWNNISIMA